MIYLDTSVLVACYCPETSSRAAQDGVRRAVGRTISPLSEVEFLSALALKTRTGGTTVEAARQVYATFRLHLAEGVFQVVPIGAREHAAACHWIGAFATTLRTVDALHLAATFCNGLTLLTADKDLARAAKHFGVKCNLIP